MARQQRYTSPFSELKRQQLPPAMGRIRSRLPAARQSVPTPGMACTQAKGLTSAATPAPAPAHLFKCVIGAARHREQLVAGPAGISGSELNQSGRAACLFHATPNREPGRAVRRQLPCPLLYQHRAAPLTAGSRRGRWRWHEFQTRIGCAQPPPLRPSPAGKQAGTAGGIRAQRSQQCGQLCGGRANLQPKRSCLARFPGEACSAPLSPAARRAAPLPLHPARMRSAPLPPLHPEPPAPGRHARTLQSQKTGMRGTQYLCMQCCVLLAPRPRQLAGQRLWRTPNCIQPPRPASQPWAAGPGTPVLPAK